MYALHTVEIPNNLNITQAKEEAQKYIKDKKKKYYKII